MVALAALAAMAAVATAAVIEPTATVAAAAAAMARQQRTHVFFKRHQAEGVRGLSRMTHRARLSVGRFRRCARWQSHSQSLRSVQSINRMHTGRFDAHSHMQSASGSLNFGWARAISSESAFKLNSLTSLGSSLFIRITSSLPPNRARSMLLAAPSKSGRGLSPHTPLPQSRQCQGQM
eukprot:6167572-Pleurochrysis_carterae.AAC.1